MNELEVEKFCDGIFHIRIMQSNTLSAYLIQVAAILKKTMQLIVEAHSIAEGRLQK
ncbi:MAG TPA: hypothetical protein VNR61_19110 [Niallia sp.]|nr:hypothetical protein [Niallia sp.]HWK24511.1 hypothetical protein [Ureibacillus sp.]